MADKGTRYGCQQPDTISVLGDAEPERKDIAVIEQWI
jgi:hypothetical protein